LKTISFLVSPEASFIPPHELQAGDRRLEGFVWLEDLRPSKQDVMAKRAPVAAPAQAAAPAKGNEAKKKPVPAKTKNNTAKPKQLTPARK
jgi:hypothetical protein